MFRYLYSKLTLILLGINPGVVGLDDMEFIFSILIFLNGTGA
jgi:hypothetical protein